MSLQHFAHAARSRKWPMLAIVLTTVATTLLTLYTRPAAYNASATVLIDAGDIDNVTRRYNPMVRPESFQGQHVANQIYLVDSERVSMLVLQDLGLDQSPELYQEWEAETGGVGNMLAWQAQRFRAGLTLALPDGRSALQIGFQGFSPELSAQFANAYVRALYKINAEMRQVQETRRIELLSARITSLRQQYQQALRAYFKAQATTPLAFSSDPMRTEGTRLRALSDSDLATRVAQGETRARSQELAKRVDAARDVASLYPVASALLEDIGAEESVLAELRAKWGDQHPTVVAARDRLSSMNSRLVRELAAVKAQERGEFDIATALNTSVERQYTAQRKDTLDGVAAMGSIRPIVQKLITLENDYTLTYLTYQQNLNFQAYVFPRLTVLNWAVAPNEPIKRPVVGMTIGSVAAGIFLALAFVVFAERRDRRVYSRADLRDELQTAVFTLPRSAI